MKIGEQYYIESWAFPYGETYKVTNIKKENDKCIIITDSFNFYLSKFEVGSHIYINSKKI